MLANRATSLVVRACLVTAIAVMSGCKPSESAQRTKAQSILKTHEQSMRSILAKLRAAEQAAKVALIAVDEKELTLANYLIDAGNDMTRDVASLMEKEKAQIAAEFKAGGISDAIFKQMWRTWIQKLQMEENAEANTQVQKRPTSSPTIGP